MKFGIPDWMNKIFRQHGAGLVCLFAVLWIYAEIRCWHLRDRLGHLWARTITINAVDDASGRHLSCSIGGIPGQDPSRDYLPWVSVNGAPISGITVASDEPVTLEIGSDGYQSQPVTISQATSGAVIVRLRKK